jgi:hypothetical protein
VAGTVYTITFDQENRFLRDHLNSNSTFTNQAGVLVGSNYYYPYRRCAF